MMEANRPTSGARETRTSRLEAVCHVRHISHPQDSPSILIRALNFVAKIWIIAQIPSRADSKPSRREDECYAHVDDVD